MRTSGTGERALTVVVAPGAGVPTVEPGTVGPGIVRPGAGDGESCDAVDDEGDGFLAAVLGGAEEDAGGGPSFGARTRMPTTARASSTSAPTAHPRLRRALARIRSSVAGPTAPPRSTPPCEPAPARPLARTRQLLRSTPT